MISTYEKFINDIYDKNIAELSIRYYSVSLKQLVTYKLSNEPYDCGSYIYYELNATDSYELIYNTAPKQVELLKNDAKQFSDWLVTQYNSKTMNKFDQMRYTVFGPMGMLYNTDRSGLFIPTNKITLPTDTITNKSYQQIMDETALTYNKLAPIVIWDNDIDSTAIIAAFIKNNIEFSVATTNSSKDKNRDLYNWVIKHCRNTQLCNDKLMVSGEVNDLLFAKSMDINATARDTFMHKHSAYFCIDNVVSANLYDEYILNKIPFDIEYYYQLSWYMDFIF